jgi:hypothetical protein
MNTVDNNRNGDMNENTVLPLPQYIKDLIPNIRESFEKYQGAWTTKQIGGLFTKEATLDVDLTRKQYQKELIEIGLTPDIYELERIDFGGEYMREIQFHINILTNKRKRHDSQDERGYYEQYEWILIGMSLICQKYRVLILRIDEEKDDSMMVFDPKNPEDQKIFDMIEIFMNRRGYERIETELLNIPLPIRWELYGIPTDISGCQTDGPFTVRHLLFGE